MFWDKMAAVIDEKKERLWTGLLHGFDKYLGVLTERAGLIQETDALRQQVLLLLYKVHTTETGRPSI
jgi:hypothetical protein